MTNPVRILVLMLLLPLVASASTNKTETLMTTVELMDGSTVIGKTDVKTVKFFATYGNWDLDFTKVRSIRFANDREKATLRMSNGDTLSGVLGLDHLEITSLIGTLKLNVAHIKRISVSPRGRDRLVLYYRFDEDLGTRVPDESGLGHEGIANGPIWTAEGKVGGAYEFDGRDDYIYYLSRDNAFGIADQITVMAWVRPRAFGHYPFILTERAGYYLNLDPSGKVAVYQYGTNPTGWHLSRTALTIGQWHHVAYTYDGRNVKIYVDGALETTVNVSGKITVPAESYVAIGQDVKSGQPQGSRQLNGTLDEVMLWARALSETEIARFYRTRR